MHDGFLIPIIQTATLEMICSHGTCILVIFLDKYGVEYPKNDLLVVLSMIFGGYMNYELDNSEAGRNFWFIACNTS